MNPEIDHLLTEVKFVREQAEGVLTEWQNGGLNPLQPEQLLWKPAANRWSIAECFEHLNLTNEAYIPALEGAIRSARAANHLSEGPYAYSLLSRFMRDQMMPPVARTFNAPARVQPKVKSADDAVARWKQTHDRVEQLIREADGIDLGGVKVKSPLAPVPFLRFNLGMVFWILLAHDRRHILQACDVAAEPGYPRPAKAEAAAAK
jgi:hypothetical protein